MKDDLGSSQNAAENQENLPASNQVTGVSQSVLSSCHELSNHLAVLNGNLYLAKKWSGDREKLLPLLDEMDRVSDQMERLVAWMRAGAPGQTPNQEREHPH